jgi:lipopolysaccharide biosynthesis glycosyltransferase
MSDRVVVSLTDPGYRALTDLTWPRVQAYARRIGADSHLITGRCWPEWSVHYEKFQMGELLGRYTRILFVDGDVVIRDIAADIFREVPMGSFGAVDEAVHIPSYWDLPRIKAQFEPYGWKEPWNGIHFNSGVMVMDITHKRIFNNLMFKTEAYFDQPFFNVRVAQHGYPFKSLDPRWNFLRWLKYSHPHTLERDAYFVHYTGLAIPPEEKAKHVRAELPPGA